MLPDGTSISRLPPSMQLRSGSLYTHNIGQNAHLPPTLYLVRIPAPISTLRPTLLQVVLRRKTSRRRPLTTSSKSIHPRSDSPPKPSMSVTKSRALSVVHRQSKRMHRRTLVVSMASGGRPSSKKSRRFTRSRQNK